MKRQLKPNIYSVGAIDWDRRLFDELIPLPDGTSYNSYLIKGKEKTALIDTVDPTKEKDLVEGIGDSGIGVSKIDYIIAHHAEQDHSGSLPLILELHPEAKVVTNAKCKEMLKDLLLIPEERFVVVSDRETLSLGDKALEFIFTPWVHWPETMVTYLKEDKILFSCDFFGSHLATSDLFVVDEAKVYDSAKRYYAEIMMPFRAAIKGNIEKLKGLPIEMIAPSHGPVYKRPSLIIDAYKDWTSDQVKPEVVLPYVSMHGSTAEMVHYFIQLLLDKGITVKPFNLTTADIGELAKALVDASTIVIGTPTVLAGAHPKALYAAALVNALRPKAKYLSVIGSFGWGGKMVEQLQALLPNIKAEILDPVLCRGVPKQADFTALKELADTVAKKQQ
ncbi:MAG: FprA family A-type flavoprotein [bacterium]